MKDSITEGLTLIIGAFLLPIMALFGLILSVIFKDDFERFNERNV